MKSRCENDYDIGQHFIVGIQGVELLQREAEILKELRPLGIILFTRNFEQNSENWIKTLQKLLTDCKNATRNKDLIISIDHEGGRVHRLPKPVSRFPYARNYASKAYEVGLAMGQELRALGFNLSFSPVLDIHLDDDNPVIGDRSFACNEKEVSEHAIKHMNGLHEAGILSCGKHFPGHGATTADSHFELPTRDISLEQLHSCELLPFKNFIAQHPPMIMSAHILFPKIDSINPATLSKTLIQQTLRESLNFQGVCISDDLEMLALGHLDPGERAAACMNAGIDILLECGGKKELPLEIANKMAARLSGDLENKITLFAESSKRITSLKSRLSELQSLSEKKDFSVVGCKKHLQLIESLEKI